MTGARLPIKAMRKTSQDSTPLQTHQGPANGREYQQAHELVSEEINLPTCVSNEITSTPAAAHLHSS